MCRIGPIVILLLGFLSVAQEVHGQDEDTPPLSFLSFLEGDWLAHAAAGTIEVDSRWTWAWSLDGHLLHGTTYQSFNGSPYTLDIEGLTSWHPGEQKVVFTNFHLRPAPLFIHGEIHQADSTTIQRDWTMHREEGPPIQGRDRWIREGANTFRWHLYFFRDGQWTEVAYSPFTMRRSAPTPRQP